MLDFFLPAFLFLLALFLYGVFIVKGSWRTRLLHGYRRTKNYIRKWVRTLLKEITEETEPEHAFILKPLHQNVRAQDDLSEIRKLAFEERFDEWVGRAGFLDAMLRDFIALDDKSENKKMFRWAMIYADAGSGKSRFALKLLEDTVAALNVAQPRLTTHSNHFGFLDLDALERQIRISRRNPENKLSYHQLLTEAIEEWSLNGPAVIVLDNASRVRGLSTMMRTLKSKAEKEKQPVRLLLLDRTDLSEDHFSGQHSEFWDTLYRDEEARQRKTTRRFAPGTRLPPLEQSDVVAIMKARIKKARSTGELTKLENSDEWLIEQLNAVTHGRGLDELRPLFAALVGGVLGKHEPQNIRRPVTPIVTAELLEDLVKQERLEQWKPFVGDDADKLNRHENLLAFSTFCGGADWGIFVDDKQMALRLPMSQRNMNNFDEKLFARMTGSSVRVQNTENSLGVLEPDLIGEWFVLHRLRTKPFGPPEAEFVKEGWAMKPEGVVNFIRKCHQNHSNDVERLNHLLPAPGDETGPYVVSLIKSMLEDVYLSLESISARGWEDLEDGEITSKHANTVEYACGLFAKLREHVDALDDKKFTEELKLEIGRAANLFSLMRAGLVSRKVRQQKFYNTQNDTEDKSARPISHDFTDFDREHISQNAASKDDSSIAQRFSGSAENSSSHSQSTSMDEPDAETHFSDALSSGPPREQVDSDLEFFDAWDKS